MLILAVGGAMAFLPAQACSFKTMHVENNLPRPDQVQISGAQPGQVVLYCTSMSAGCKGMRDHLQKIGLAFVDKDIVNDKQACAEFDALGGQGVPLVAFKQRLMHGYYPTSFDRLYAQYHSGEVLPTTAATSALNAKAAGPAAVSGPSPIAAAPAVSQAAEPPTRAIRSPQVEELAPADFMAYLKKHPNVVVQFTSADVQCVYCVDGSFEAFNVAAVTYASPTTRFARVQWSPWRTFPKGVYAVVGGGIPTHAVFKYGQLSAQVWGSLRVHKGPQDFQGMLTKHAGAPP